METGRCSYRSCKYAHIRKGEQLEQSNPPRGQEKTTNGRQKEEPIYNLEKEFHTWRSNIPLTLTFIRPLRRRLAYFFQEAWRLIEIDANLMQNVIECLAKEGGLKRIQELVEQEFDNMPAAVKTDTFTDQILPFFQTVSHPNILGSLALDYNFIFGIEGRRTCLLFDCVLDVLASASQTEEATVTYLESSLVVFSHIVDVNSVAFIQKSLKPLAKRFEAVFIALRAAQGANTLLLACTYLERIERRLEIGS